MVGQTTTFWKLEIKNWRHIKRIKPIILEFCLDYVIGLSKDLNMNFRLMESSTKGFYLQFILPGRVWELPDLPQYFLNVRII